MTQFRAMTPNYINNDVPLQKLHLEHNGKFKNYFINNVLGT